LRLFAILVVFYFFVIRYDQIFLKLMKKIIELLPDKEEVCFVIKVAFSKSFCNQLIAQKRDSFQSAHSHYPTSYRNEYHKEQYIRNWLSYF